MAIERIVTIGADHPSLGGHFPGHPVVPGVVMLGEVMHAIREITKEDIKFVGLPVLKLMSPLNPGEPLTIRCDRPIDDIIEFSCSTASRRIASGCLRYRVVPDESLGDL